MDSYEVAGTYAMTATIPVLITMLGFFLKRTLIAWRQRDD